MDKAAIKNAIIKSQHCQRNWDLSQSIPQDDLDLLIHASTQCPSKQNISFYNLHFIQNRELIEQVHLLTSHPSRHPDHEFETNPQTLANLLVVFEDLDVRQNISSDDIYRNAETHEFLNFKKDLNLDIDKHTAVGIAAGYLNLTSSILGYSTGCCACFDGERIKELLNLKGGILLLMGIGYKDPNRNRREHHKDSNFIFSTKSKQPISYNIIK